MAVSDSDAAGRARSRAAGRLGQTRRSSILGRLRALRERERARERASEEREGRRDGGRERVRKGARERGSEGGSEGGRAVLSIPIPRSLARSPGNDDSDPESRVHVRVGRRLVPAVRGCAGKPGDQSRRGSEGRDEGRDEKIERGEGNENKRIEGERDRTGHKESESIKRDE